MAELAIDPLLADLRTMDCGELLTLLDLDSDELYERIHGPVPFNVPERMSIARWIGRPMATVFAPLDGLVGASS